MTQGELNDAIRRALNILDAWMEVTGAVPSAYRYELQGVVEDAVRCGAQAACGVKELLSSEQ